MHIAVLLVENFQIGQNDPNNQMLKTPSHMFHLIYDHLDALECYKSHPSPPITTHRGDIYICIILHPHP
jgi:hypothetical protein